MAKTQAKDTEGTDADTAPTGDLLLEASPRNPLIGGHWTNTVHNCESVAAFLARMHDCIADTEEAYPAFFDADTYLEKRGLACVLGCMQHALRHAWVEGGKAVQK